MMTYTMQHCIEKNVGPCIGSVVCIKKLQKDLNNNSPHLGYRLHLKGSRANSPQVPVHWLREVTKAKLSQAEQSLGKLGQAGPS